MLNAKRTTIILWRSRPKTLVTNSAKLIRWGRSTWKGLSKSTKTRTTKHTEHTKITCTKWRHWFKRGTTMTTVGPRTLMHASSETSRIGLTEEHRSKSGATRKLQTGCSIWQTWMQTLLIKQTATTKESKTTLIDSTSSSSVKMTFTMRSPKFARSRASMLNWRRWTKWSCNKRKLTTSIKTIMNR